MKFKSNIYDLTVLQVRSPASEWLTNFLYHFLIKLFGRIVFFSGGKFTCKCTSLSRRIQSYGLVYTYILNVYHPFFILSMYIYPSIHPSNLLILVLGGIISLKHHYILYFQHVSVQLNLLFLSCTSCVLNAHQLQMASGYHDGLELVLAN